MALVSILAFTGLFAVSDIEAIGHPTVTATFNSATTTTATIGVTLATPGGFPIWIGTTSVSLTANTPRAVSLTTPGLTLLDSPAYAVITVQTPGALRAQPQYQTFVKPIGLDTSTWPAGAEAMPSALPASQRPALNGISATSPWFMGVMGSNTALDLVVAGDDGAYFLERTVIAEGAFADPLGVAPIHNTLLDPSAHPLPTFHLFLRDTKGTVQIDESPSLDPSWDGFGSGTHGTFYYSRAMTLANLYPAAFDVGPLTYTYGDGTYSMTRTDEVTLADPDVLVTPLGAPAGIPDVHINWGNGPGGNGTDLHNQSPHQRYAYDIGIVDGNGQGSAVASPTTTQFYTYGAEVRAMRDGVVIRVEKSHCDVGDTTGAYEAGCSGYQQNTIWLDHGDGKYSVYAHLRHGITLNAGDYVGAGEVIAHVGANGGYGGYPHLHVSYYTFDEFGDLVPLPMAFYVPSSWSPGVIGVPSRGLRTPPPPDGF